MAALSRSFPTATAGRVAALLFLLLLLLFSSLSTAAERDAKRDEISGENAQTEEKKAESTAVQLILGKQSPFGDRNLYYLTTCKGVAMAFVGYDAGKTGDRNLTVVVEDPTSSCKLRILAPFETANGDVIDVEQGFDPCAFTTCRGSKHKNKNEKDEKNEHNENENDGLICETAGTVLTQQYFDLDAYVKWREPLQFPPASEVDVDGNGACTCRSIADEMEDSRVDPVPATTPNDPSQSSSPDDNNNENNSENNNENNSENGLPLSIRGEERFDGFFTYYPTTCGTGDSAFAIAFSDWTPSSPSSQNGFTIARDSPTKGRLRILAPFLTNSGESFTAEQGFDPCKYTTCDGVTCDTDGYLLTQEYDDVKAYASYGRNLTFPNYQSAASSGPRCVCRNPKDKMKQETTLFSSVNKVTVDPAGPSAEKDDTVCTGLACGDDASVALTYYLHSDDTTLTGCQCCKKQPALLSPSSSSKPTCGVVTPNIKADAGLREDDILKHTDGRAYGNGFSRYFTTRCKSKNADIAFSTFVASYGGYASFGAVADAKADGGLRIMAPFKTNSGESFTAEQGFDPCKYTTCDGVTCDTDGYVLTQEYYSLYDYTSSSNALTFPDYQKSGDYGEPRCTCRNPETQMSREMLPSTAYYDNLTVDPAGPSAEQSDAICKGLTCDTKASVALTYYLLSDDQTLTGCQCCKKQSKRVAPSEYASAFADCGAMRPTILSDSGLKPGALLNYIAGSTGGSSQSRYFLATCKSTGEQIAFSTYVSSYQSDKSFGAVADPNADGGLRIMAPFKTNSGESFTVEQGFDPCKYTTCGGVRCNTPGFALTQEYYDLRTFVSSNRNLSFPPYHATADSGASRCTCRNTTDFMKRETVNWETFDNLTVLPDGPSAQVSDAVCYDYACSTTHAEDVLYYLTFTKDSKTGCQCCLKDPTILSEPSSDYTPQCNISQVINKPTTTAAPSTSPSPSSSSSPSADPAPAAWHLPYLQSLSHACPTSELRGVEYGSLVADSGEMCCTFRDVAGAVSAPQCGAQMLQLAHGPGTLSCSGTVGNRPVSCCGAVDRLGKVRGNGRVCRGH